MKKSPEPEFKKPKLAVVHWVNVTPPVCFLDRSEMTDTDGRPGITLEKALENLQEEIDLGLWRNDDDKLWRINDDIHTWSWGYGDLEVVAVKLAALKDNKNFKELKELIKIRFCYNN